MEKYSYGIIKDGRVKGIEHIKADNIQISSSGVKFSIKGIQFNLYLL